MGGHGKPGIVMPGGRFLLWSTLAGLMALPLAGCGVIPMVAQQTTAAVLRPFTTAAQAVGTDLQIIGRGISSMTAQTTQNSRQITMAMAQSRAMMPPPTARIEPRTVSYPSPRPATSNFGPAPAARRTPGEAGAKLDVLPADVLSRLTPDQAGLQRAAQNEALTADVGETIFWHLEGREGTAMTESENLMGGFICRTFVQTLALEDYFDKASVTACRTENGAWTQSF